MPQETDLKVLSDASTVRRAERLLRFVARLERGEGTPTEGDRGRLLWLETQLLTSRRGAESATTDNLGAAPVDRQTDLGEENVLYEFFRSYSAAGSPTKHAEWVDSLLTTLQALETAQRWADVDLHARETVHDQIVPLLRRLRESSGRVPSRDEPLAAV